MIKGHWKADHEELRETPKIWSTGAGIICAGAFNGLWPAITTKSEQIPQTELNVAP